MQELKQLEELIDSKRELAGFGGGVPQKTVMEQEKELGVLLPLSYCWFLLRYGVGSFGNTEIFGILTDENGEKVSGDSIPNFAWVTEYFRKEGLDNRFIVISGNGMGQYFCIETESKNRKVDSKVYIFERENPSKTCNQVSSSFKKFLREIIEKEIEYFEEEEEIDRIELF